MPLQTEYNKDTISESILNKLLRYYGCTIEDDAQADLRCRGDTVPIIMLKWRFEKEARRSEKAKRVASPASDRPLAAQQPAQPLPTGECERR
ncbi:MAG: hypothetical protein ACLUI3_14375 [Christensenellales bacterium]